MKSGNLNFLEPSEPLQACNGTALPFYCSYIADCDFPSGDWHSTWRNKWLNGTELKEKNNNNKNNKNNKNKIIIIIIIIIIGGGGGGRVVTSDVTVL